MVVVVHATAADVDRVFAALADGTRRDIVRRAIAARLMLGDTRDGLKPLWPLTGGDAKVDRSLVRRDTRDEWRQRIVDTAAAYGLPLLAEAAPPLVDYLRHE